ncbi:hypothetical protein I5Q34_21105 [Streptomyces sp. AV19]|uniref:hypothetical protein n=1 Tax=Streptomyces sp. AV19 TaxID=2793068 RepID=UPI0018FE9BBF|nr:hypothetical protein [Streptomyces sp. AV19]MBH1936745.1 hypothetical protein [Streptomyces sp. AV19]MDG4532805.1 hypothetical protein [Streptomyces sp. AV19]
MKNVLGFVSFVLIVGGLAGLVHEWIGGFRLFGFLRYATPEGYEVYANVVFVVLGIAVGALGAAKSR